MIVEHIVVFPAPKLFYYNNLLFCSKNVHVSFIYKPLSKIITFKKIDLIHSRSEKDLWKPF